MRHEEKCTDAFVRVALYRFAEDEAEATEAESEDFVVDQADSDVEVFKETKEKKEKKETREKKEKKEKKLKKDMDDASEELADVHQKVVADVFTDTDNLL